MRRWWRICVAPQGTERRVLAGALLWLSAAVLARVPNGANAAPDAQAPAPFVAKFAIEWKGITAGYSQLELTRSAPNAYTYKSRNMARGIFRLAFPDAISQISNFSIVDGEVRPSAY